MKRTFLLIAAGVALVAIMAAMYKYNQPHKNAEDKAADVTLSADKLYNTFKTSEASANKIYLNKVIETSGLVDDIIPSEQYTIVVIASKDPMGGVSCKFSGTEIKNDIKKGAAITVKGICTGYLSDVNLVDCVIVK